MKAIEEFYDKDYNGALVVDNLTWKYFNEINYPHRQLQYTKEQISFFGPVFYFRKTSIFRNVFNQQIRRIRESGLPKHWNKKYTKDHPVKWYRVAPEKLSFKNTLAAIEICFIMYFVSCVVFILELLSTRYQCLQKFLDFLTY